MAKGCQNRTTERPGSLIILLINCLSLDVTVCHPGNKSPRWSQTTCSDSTPNDIEQHLEPTSFNPGFAGSILPWPACVATTPIDQRPPCTIKLPGIRITAGYKLSTQDILPRGGRAGCVYLHGFLTQMVIQNWWWLEMKAG